MRCIVVRGDAWPLLLSPCGTGLDSLAMLNDCTCVDVAVARCIHSIVLLHSHIHMMRQTCCCAAHLELSIGVRCSCGCMHMSEVGFLQVVYPLGFRL